MSLPKTGNHAELFAICEMQNSATKDQVSRYISLLMAQFLVEYEDSNGRNLIISLLMAGFLVRLSVMTRVILDPIFSKGYFLHPPSKIDRKVPYGQYGTVHRLGHVIITVSYFWR